MQTTDNLGANKLTEKELSIAIIGGTGDLGSGPLTKMGQSRLYYHNRISI